ncbi:hypothetical protein PHET_02562 [Paragonimus heterotremus]|uniref:Methyltransferase type 11 domain-containing protein n=1 Tax=Paragonimus heterotremus TaxID=100268 RepID=A0A8J4WJL0_9TREM|nr:hypothetical protein PHET_02562 [Paragonimus heterotremus]
MFHNPTVDLLVFERALLRIAGKHTQSSDFDSICVYPLTCGSPVCLPIGFKHLTQEKFVRLYEVIPEFGNTVKRPTRRAEVAGQLIFSSKDRLNFLRRHLSREYIQVALYRFALETCFGLPVYHQDPKLFFSSGNVLVDLGAGDVNSNPTVGTLLSRSHTLVIGADLYHHWSCLLSSPINRLTCDLVQQQTIPLRNECADFVVSISFIQWLIASPGDKSTIVNAFLSEVARLLRSGGQCVLQFYPQSGADINLVCHQLTCVHPHLSGCRIVSRPLLNRGLKVFIYARRTD